MDKKILQVTSVVTGKVSTFGAECLHNKFDGGYYAVAWNKTGTVVTTTRVYRKNETAWRNLKMQLALKYGED